MWLGIGTWNPQGHITVTSVPLLISQYNVQLPNILPSTPRHSLINVATTIWFKTSLCTKRHSKPVEDLLMDYHVSSLTCFTYFIHIRREKLKASSQIFFLLILTYLPFYCEAFAWSFRIYFYRICKQITLIIRHTLHTILSFVFRYVKSFNLQLQLVLHTEYFTSVPK
jgi:hypothetical protein